MKKNLFVIVFLVLVLVIALGYSVLAQGVSLGGPDQEVTAISLELTTPPYSFAKDENGFDVLLLEGFDLSGGIGNPQLPSQVYNLALPPDADPDSLSLDVTVLDSEEQKGSFQLAPVSPPATWIDGEMVIDWGENAESIVDGKNTLIYGNDSYFPDQNAELISLPQMRKWIFAQVLFNPIQYNPVSGKLKIARQVKITLSVKTGNPVVASSLSDTIMDDVAADLFYNYESARQWYGGKPSQPSPATTYVIITTNAIESGSSNLASFISHKQSRGFNVLTITEDEYGSLTGPSPNGTAEKIRKWLKDNYVSQNIEYVLLIGNPDPDDPSSGTDPVGDVPMKMLWPRRGATSYPEYEESPSDYFYADLTGNWDLDGDGYYGEYNGDRGPGGIDFAAEVYVGRIPVYSTSYTALDSILQKTIDYENESLASIGWRESALLPMSFSDSTTDGAYLAEKMMDNYLDSSGYSSWTMYQQGSQCAAANSSFSSDEELFGNTVVRDRWSANDFGIVNWWGHGSSTSASYGYDTCGWGTLFSYSQASALDDDHPSLVYQCSCTNGYPELSYNLGYSILANGGIGTVSASRVSWYRIGSWSPSTSYADNAAIGYYWHREIVLNDHSAGKALYLAKFSQANGWGDQSYMNKDDFNLYGDPAISITSAALIPDPPTNVQASDGTYTDKVRVTWNASAGASSYVVFRATSAGGTQTNLGEISSTTFDDITAAVGTTYYYWVSACGGSGCSIQSDYDTGYSAVTYKNYLPLVLKNYQAGGGWVNIKTEDFEGSFPNEWDVNDYGPNSGEYYWGERSCEVYEGNYSGWGVGGGADGSVLSCGSYYPDDVESWMEYGPFSLETAIDAELNFAFWLNSETDYDFIFFGAAINGVNYYGNLYWGNSSGWVTYSFDLTDVYTLGDLTGQTQVWIAFVFFSDSSITYQNGVFIDNIVLRKCDSNCGETTASKLHEGVQSEFMEIILGKEKE